MISIRAFKATDEPETCHRFLEGHRKVLEEFNLANISSNTPTWMQHANTYVIIGEYNGQMIGGARMQIADGTIPLPVQDAVAHYDSKINNLVHDKMADGGASELCGLWNARTLPPNLGITLKISRAAVSIANQIQTKNVFAICAGYTLQPAMRMGMQIQKSVGNNGEFIYPNSNFKARVLCMDGYSLATANAEFRQEMETIRKDKNFITTIQLEQEEVSLAYSLDLADKKTNKE